MRIASLTTALSLLCLLAASAFAPVTGVAQEIAPDASQPPAIVVDLLTDIDQARDKLLQLADAIPEDQWTWRPGEGVRSVREVFLHVAADNYLLPAALGGTPPASTGISVDDFSTAQAYERQELGKAETIAALQASFDHLVDVIGRTDEANLTDRISIFGGEWSRQGFLVLTTTHLHEHLGQMIAYARMNDVVPPWSAQTGG
jgi:uncharacterized damage-inducible protein DinB